MKTITLVALATLLISTSIPAVLADTASDAQQNTVNQTTNVKTHWIRSIRANRKLALKQEAADKTDSADTTQTPTGSLGFGTDNFIIN